jgi:4'-phosphopantetheinyl transferase
MEPVSCEVWWAETAWLRAWHTSILSAGERARCARPGTPHRTIAAALVRLVGARHTTMRPAARIEVDRTCPHCGEQHGRPRLIGSDLHVSVSHAGDRVVVAACRGAEVGIDVEPVTGLTAAEIAPLALGDDEVPHAVDARTVLTYWTRKEAIVKATGDGIEVPLRDVRVSPPGATPRLLGYPGRDGLVAQLLDLRTGDGYVGALAVLVPGPVVVRETSAERLLTAAGPDR